MNGHQANWALSNPIPGMVQDKKDLVTFFSQAKFLVPYAKQTRTTAHATLRLLFDLYELSPIQKSVVSAKADFCFGNGIRTRNGDAETTDAFFELMRSFGIDPVALTDQARSAMRDEAVCGTTFLLCRAAQSGSEWAASVVKIPPTHCLPCYDYDNEHSDFSNTVLYADREIGNDFNLSGQKLKTEWRMVGKYPRVTKRGGVFETMIQMNSVGYEEEYWGRPTADTNWLYIDYQQSNMAAKISASEVVSKVLLLMKEPDLIKMESAGVSADEVKQEITDGLRKTMTNRGSNSQSLAAIFYEDEVPSVEQIGINRDYQYSESVRKMAVQNICAAHGIPANLVGLEEMRVGLGGTVVMDTLIKTNGMKVVPTQKRFARMFQDFVAFLSGQIGFDANPYQIEFVGPIPEMIEQLKEVRQTTRQNGENSNPVDAPGSGGV